MRRRRKPCILPKLRPYGTRQKHCAIIWTDRYIAIYSYDIYGGSHFSPEGIATHRPRDAITPVWLGKTTRDALLASRFLIPEECFAPDVPLDREKRIALETASSERRLAFWDEIAATYGYKNREAAWNRDGQTRAERKALCRAYHDAMNDVSAANGKSLTFNINPVS